MRVGLVIYGDLNYTSGGFLYDRRVVEYLRAAGDQVEVISLPWRTYAQHLGDNLSRHLTQRLRSLEVDLLLQDELNHPSFFWMNQRLRHDLGWPIVTIIHHLRSREAHPWLAHRLYRQVERAYLQSVDGWVCVSDTTRRDVRALAGMEKPSVVCHPASDAWAGQPTLGDIAARAAQPGPLKILFVGNVIPRKGLNTLIAAVGQLPGGAAILRVAGNLDSDRKYTAHCKLLVRRLGLEGWVEFLGGLTRAALGAEMRMADVMAVPSSYEGFGIVYLEGLGFGLPGIGGRAGAAGEVLSEGETGFLVSPGDVAALAQRLEMLASDRQRLAAMSLAARRDYERRPGWQATGSGVRNFLAEILANAII